MEEKDFIILEMQKIINEEQEGKKIEISCQTCRKAYQPHPPVG